MKHVLIGLGAAIFIAGPVWAQAPWTGAPPPQWPSTAYSYPDPNRYRSVAPTARDAYRLGLINRWELEQLEGPEPQALQGPSPDSSKGPGRGS